MKVAKAVMLGCFIVWASTLATEAKDKPGKNANKNEAQSQAKEAGASKAVDVKLVLSDDERRLIRTYVDGHPGKGRSGKKGLPPGLAKKLARGEELPPGWQKKCVRGEIMPAEVFEKCHALPPELVVKLPTPPVGTVTVSIGGQVVRLIKATREILDVFNVHPW